MSNKIESERSLNALCWIVLSVLFFAIVLVPVASAASSSLIALVWVSLLIIGTPIWLICLCAVHEFGHYLAGLTVGYELFTFRVAGYQLWKSGDSWRFMFSGSKSQLNLVEMIPRQGVKHVARRHTVVVLGGPIASWIVFGWMTLVYSHAGGFGDFRELDSRQEAVARILFFAWILASGVAGSIFIAMKTSTGHASDGLQLKNLWKHRQVTVHHIIAAMISVPWVHNRRPRRWNGEAVEYLLRNATDEASKASAGLIAFYYYFDKEERERALKEIFTAAEHASAVGGMMDKRTAHMIFAEAAYCSARFLHDAIRARSYLEMLPRPDINRYTEYYRGEAAILWEEGAHQEARELVSWSYDQFQKGPVKRGDEGVDFEVSALLDIVTDEKLGPVATLA